MWRRPRADFLSSFAPRRNVCSRSAGRLFRAAIAGPFHTHAHQPRCSAAVQPSTTMSKQPSFLIPHSSSLNRPVVPETPVIGPQMAANGSPWQVLRPVVGCQFPVASCRLPHHSPLTTDHSPLTTHQLVVLCQLPHDSRLTTHQSVLRCQLSVATPLTSHH